MACSSCKTVQWNKHDSANYAMFEQNLTFQDNKHDSANYAMFEQSVLETDPQLYNIITTLINRVTTNERNLIKVGSDNTYFGNKVVEIDNRIAGLESRPSGSGYTKAEIEKIFIDYYGDDIQRHDQQLVNLGNSIIAVDEATKSNRLAIDRNSDNLIKVGTDLASVGNSINDIWNSIKRIDTSMAVSDFIGGNGSGDECGFFDVQCKLSKGISGVLPYVAIAGLGYLVLRKK